MHDKQREAMEAANPYPMGCFAHNSDAWEEGAEWMHAHDAEKVAGERDRLREALDAIVCETLEYTRQDGYDGEKLQTVIDARKALTPQPVDTPCPECGGSKLVPGGHDSADPLDVEPCPVCSPPCPVCGTVGGGGIMYRSGGVELEAIKVSCPRCGTTDTNADAD